MTATSSSDYDKHLYPTTAQAQLHPDNIYSNAFLRGFQPAPVMRARVLELGCGNGRNLIPMALDLPTSEFVGLDYAEAPIASARAAAAHLRISNIDFRQADVLAFAQGASGAEIGQFDYIIAHGFYSWVPDAVRDAFWCLVEKCLAPKGLLCLSFNTLPGWHQVRVLRDFAFFHMEPLHVSEDRFRAAWDAVRITAKAQEQQHPLAMEAARTLHKGFELALFDEIYPETHPFYFRDVVSSAMKHGLRYVCDAKERFRHGLQESPELQQFVHASSDGDTLRREQYLDFLTMRRFRQSIFTRTGHVPHDIAITEAMVHLWISSEHRAGAQEDDGRRTISATHSEFRFCSDNPLVCALFDSLAAAAPATLHLGEWLESVQIPVTPENRAALGLALTQGILEGVFACYPRSIEPALRISARPQVRPLNRWEAACGFGLTNLYHRVFPTPDPLLAGMVSLLDGELSVEDISGLLTGAILEQNRTGADRAEVPGASIPLLSSSAFKGRDQVLASAATLHHFLQRLLPAGLEQLRVGALLIR